MDNACSLRRTGSITCVWYGSVWLDPVPVRFGLVWCGCTMPRITSVCRCYRRVVFLIPMYFWVSEGRNRFCMSLCLVDDRFRFGQSNSSFSRVRLHNCAAKPKDDVDTVGRCYRILRGKDMMHKFFQYMETRCISALHPSRKSESRVLIFLLT